MAEIFLARQKTELGAFRRCVVKKILPELANHRTFAEMIVHEAKLAARLSHANVVQVFDLGRAGDRLFIAMEYVEGFDLNDLLRRCARSKVPLPWEMSVHVMRESLKGLDYAHRRTDDEGKPLGIVHRDVSPSNLLISFEGEVKVCDFGIARANEVIQEGAARPREQDLDEALKGKAGYMSPEHARGEAVDARADVFAAGIVLWELAAGRRMYKTGEGREPLIAQARSPLTAARATRRPPRCCATSSRTLPRPRSSRARSGSATGSRRRSARRSSPSAGLASGPPPRSSGGRRSCSRRSSRTRTHPSRICRCPTRRRRFLGLPRLRPPQGRLRPRGRR